MKRLDVPLGTKTRCPQCWRSRTLDHFLSHTGRQVKMCDICRARYRGWAKKTDEQRIKAHPRMHNPRLSAHRVLLAQSHNRKTGELWVSITDRSSCPPSCPLYCRGCYAEFHWTRLHWLNTPRDGVGWSAFCDAIEDLDPGQLWRHNEAGDLPGRGDELDHVALGQLVEANSGRRGWTYTHKPVTPKLKEALLHANRGGFAIALSTEGVTAADAAASLGVAPVVTVLGADVPAPSLTPKGRRLVVCQGGHNTTCERCGLCAIPDRDFIVAFRAHGQWKDLVGKLAAS